MTTRLEKLLKAAKTSKMSAEDYEEQRQSFAYGNTHIENENVTRETIYNASKKLKAEKEK